MECENKRHTVHTPERTHEQQFCMIITILILFNRKLSSFLFYFSRNYKIQRGGMKQWYLLSVFLGDVIRDPTLCKRLAKRIPCNHDISKAHVKY